MKEGGAAPDKLICFINGDFRKPFSLTLKCVFSRVSGQKRETRGFGLRKEGYWRFFQESQRLGG